MMCNFPWASRRWWLPLAASLWLASNTLLWSSTLTVTTTADSGAGSLRQAMLDANVSDDLDTIVFQIPGTGVKSISLLSTLPAIRYPVVLDATTQPGYAGTPRVELNGTYAGESAALKIYSGGTTIRGLAINRFAAQAIRIEGGSSNWIAGNFIGTTTSGTAASANSREGVWVNYSSYNLIGGTNAADKNVISGNGQEAGVYVLGGGGNSIQGNVIGLNLSGTAAIANAVNGLVISGSYSNLVGGSGSGMANIISGNVGSGVYITGSAAVGNVVQGNLIGLAANGSSVVKNGGDGVTILSAPSNLIGGTNAAEVNVISGNQKAGVSISGSSAKGNRVCGNFIGTDATGRLAAGNTLAGVTLSGVTGNWIGAPAVGAGNVISANKQDGVFLTTNSNANVLFGNLIGLDVSGTNKLSNLNDGVLISMAHSNVIGSAALAARNMISGNLAHGIQIINGCSNTVVEGNYIGTDITGARAVPNGAAPPSPLGFGVFLTSASANTIRGNTVSGNYQAGIYIGASSTANAIQGNRVGTDSGGMLVVSNCSEGIMVQNGSYNLLGGPTPADGNVISGNGTWAISLTNAVGNTIQQNTIGTAINRTTPMSNATRRSTSGFHSIELMNDCRNNVIAENLIAWTPAVGGTGYAGVRVRDRATNNAILGNSFVSNSGLGVDIGAYQVSPNDSCDADSGANQLQNFPVLTQCVTGGGTGVRGVLNSRPNTTYRLEFFASSGCHASGYGEGQLYLGSQNVTTDGSCSAAFTAKLVPGIPPGYLVTATATDPSSNTSEFSACAQSVAVPTLATVRTADTLKFSWPSASTGFVLREASSLTPPVDWRPVTNAVTTLNGQFLVTVPMDSANRFFVLSFE